MPRTQKRKAAASVNYIDESEDEITESTTNRGTKSAITEKTSTKISESNTNSRKRRNSPSIAETGDNIQNEADSSAKKTKTTRGRKPGPKKAVTRKKAMASDHEMEVDEENNKKEEDKENLEMNTRSKKSADKQTRGALCFAMKDGNKKDEATWKEKYDELKRDYEKQTQKYDALKILKETEVEKNFAAYKKIAEEQIESLKGMTNQMQIEKKQLEDNNECLQGEIATLKKELGKQAKQAKTKLKVEESAHSKGKNGVNIDDDKFVKMRKESAELWEKNNELQKSVHFLEKQNAAEVENSKRLQAQVANLSTLKTNTVAVKNFAKSGASSNNSLEEVHNLKRMRTLYEDVTGLVIHTFKLDEEGGCTFNIHQTGRNGTVQFHLSESVDSQNLLIYHPVLDHSRDQRIIEILPDYLQEDIEFERGPNSTMFFWRLLNFLQKDHTAGKK